MAPSALEGFRVLTAAYEPVRPDSIAADARVVDTDKIGDHETVIVSAKIDNTRRQRLFFDTTSGLLVRRVILTLSPAGEIPEQTDFDDYHDVGGTKFPFYTRVSLVDPWSGATRRYSEVQIGAAVDDKVFSPLPVTPPSAD